MVWRRGVGNVMFGEVTVMHYVRSGFTLLELLIVIAVVAVLGAVFVPNLVSSRKAANYLAAAVMLRNLSADLLLCATDNGDFPPDAGPNAAPAGCAGLDWPAPDEVPFGSTIDFENWTVGTGRWVGLTFYGAANNRAGIPVYTDLGPGFVRHEVGNNTTFSLALEVP